MYGNHNYLTCLVIIVHTVQNMCLFKNKTLAFHLNEFDKKYIFFLFLFGNVSVNTTDAICREEKRTYIQLHASGNKKSTRKFNSTHSPDHVLTYPLVHKLHV